MDFLLLFIFMRWEYERHIGNTYAVSYTTFYITFELKIYDQ